MFRIARQATARRHRRGKGVRSQSDPQGRVLLSPAGRGPGACRRKRRRQIDLDEHPVRRHALRCRHDPARWKRIPAGNSIGSYPPRRRHRASGNGDHAGSDGGRKHLLSPRAAQCAASDPPEADASGLPETARRSRLCHRPAPHGWRAFGRRTANGRDHPRHPARTPHSRSRRADRLAVVASCADGARLDGAPEGARHLDDFHLPPHERDHRCGRPRRRSERWRTDARGAARRVRP
jgi:hypothetical protein